MKGRKKNRLGADTKNLHTYWPNSYWRQACTTSTITLSTDRHRASPMHFECPICGAKYPFSPIGCRCGHKGPFALIDSAPPGPRHPLPQSFIIAAVFGIGVLVATQNWMAALVVGVAAALISSTRIGMF